VGGEDQNLIFYGSAEFNTNYYFASSQEEIEAHTQHIERIPVPHPTR
jgi:hypothetical protein